MKDRNNKKITIVRRIKEKHGLTAKKMAEILGVSHRTVEDWCGGQNPSVAAVLLIKKHFAEE